MKNLNIKQKIKPAQKDGFEVKTHNKQIPAKADKKF
jgi:hypothetical protein